LIRRRFLPELSPFGENPRSGYLKVELKPVYTVPENATLIGSTAFTALIGRIPIRGRVQDPWPFKVITGAANLAANGLKLPEVAGMVWSGTAVGDWTLGCVRGWVTSVTFVFRDGTIRTVNSAQNNTARSLINDGVVSDNALGWISDKLGTPCLSGTRITNAPEFLTQRVALLAAQAAAEAAASSQTTTITGAATGTVTQTVNDSTQFILGKTISGGVDEINKWLLERQQQSFDAIFVRAGAEVAINISKEIAVDYDPEGRRLRHVNEKSLHRRTQLD
jgi:integrating conjugative element protein (TIGR03752 family)